MVRLLFSTAYFTYSKISFYTSAAATAANALRATGHQVTAAARAGLSEVVREKIPESALSQLSLDENQLFTTRTVKIRALNQKTRELLPEIQNISNILAKSLEEIQQEVLNNENVQLGETGATLRKNLMLRQAITPALDKLYQLQSAALDAHSDAQQKKAQLQSELENINNSIDLTNAQINQLKTELFNELQNQALSTLANHTHQASPVPPPNPSIEPDPPETYYSRLAQARLIEAINIWNQQAPPLLNSINSTRSQILQALQQVDANLNALDSCRAFVDEFKSPPIYGPTFKSSLSQMWNELARIESLLSHQDNWQNVVNFTVPTLEQLLELEGQLVTNQNQLSALLTMVNSVGYYPNVANDVWNNPANRIPHTSNYLALYGDLPDLLPTAITNANAIRLQLEEDTSVLLTATSSALQDFSSELAQAETAYSNLHQSANNWKNLINLYPYITLNSSTHYGKFYYSNPYDPSSEIQFDPIITKTYSHAFYINNLLNLIQSRQFNQAHSLAANYTIFLSIADQITHQFNTNLQKFHSAYRKLLRALTPNRQLAPLIDWTQCQHRTNKPSPPNSSDPTFPSLYNILLQVNHFESGIYTGTHASICHHPTLIEPVFDDPSQIYAHKLLAIQSQIQAQRDAILNTPPDQFQSVYSSLSSQIGELSNPPTIDAHISAENFGPPFNFDPFYFGLAHYNGYQAIATELFYLSNEYLQAHPAPTFLSQSANITASIPAGQSYSTTLTAHFQGNFLTYSWQTSQLSPEEYPNAWQTIPNSNSNTLQTPPISPSSPTIIYYRCAATAPGGTTYGLPISIQIYPTYAPIQFNFPPSVQAYVNQPFQLQLAASPQPTFWQFMPIEGNASWLSINYDTGLLSGTPTQPSTLLLQIFATNGQSFGNQNLYINILPSNQSNTPSSFSNWLSQHLTPQQLQDPIWSNPFAAPSQDNVPTIIKFLLNVPPDQPANPKLPRLEPDPNSSSLRFSYQFSPLHAQDLSVTLQQSFDLQSWSPLTPAPSDISDTSLPNGEIRRTIRVPGPPPSTNRVFYRLHVQFRQN